MAKIEGYEMPDELYYHKDHAWVRVEGDGTVTIGMTDLYQQTAGDTTYVDLPFEGDEVEEGETCGKIQSAKWVGKFVSPMSGEILEVNEDLEDESTLINSDPYGEGWIMKIKPGTMDDELGELVHGDGLEDFVKQKIAEAEAQK